MMTLKDILEIVEHAMKPMSPDEAIIFLEQLETEIGTRVDERCKAKDAAG